MSERDDDRLLSEYLDGALDGAERAELEARLAAEAPLARRLARFEAADRWAQRWSEAALAAPSPEAVAVIRGKGRTRSGGGGWRWLAPWLMPAAAAVAVAVLGLAGLDRAVDRRVNDAMGRLRAERAADMQLLANAMQEMLETQESEIPVTFTNAETGFSVTMVTLRTWRSKSGHWCRQFVEMFQSTTPEEAPVSIACRNRDGQWQRLKTELSYPATATLPPLLAPGEEGRSL